MIDSSVSMRHETQKKTVWTSIAGQCARILSSTPTGARSRAAGTDPIAEHLQEALEEWRRQRDGARLRRALLDLLLRLER
jgi:hypothetical protein